MLSDNLNEKHLPPLGQFLNVLSVIQKGLPDIIIDDLEKTVNYINDHNLTENDFRIIFAGLCCYMKNNETLKEKLKNHVNKLSDALCDVFEKSESSSRHIHEASVTTALTLFRLINFCSKLNNGVITWFIVEHNKSFWRPLLKVLCHEDPLISNVIKFDLQNASLSFFKTCLYLNQPNQKFFCEIIIDILKEQKQREPAMNGYMKYLLLQLIISEELVEVYIQSKLSMYILQNKHRFPLPVTSLLGDLEEKIKGTYTYQPRVEKCYVQNPAKSKETVNENSNMEEWGDCMFEASKAAVLKRQQKCQKKEPSKEKSVNVIGEPYIAFYVTELSDKPIPKNVKLGQILQKLHDKNPEILSIPPLLEYKVSFQKSNDKTKASDVLDANLYRKYNESKAMENSELLDVNMYPTALATFAELEGLPYLAHQTQNNTMSYINLFSSILPLPGFHQVFLKDRYKAELLLRLVMGIKETKSGRKYF